ncbi:MAG: hypothetical protein AB3X46_09195 [Leptothrix ochracea]|uniref:hypothetical protein n=1 Tax=Leptothrix ochracea TaxID=735331 RepID=UPI0034E21377
MTASYAPEKSLANPLGQPQTPSDLDEDGWAAASRQRQESEARRELGASLISAAGVSPDKAAQSQFMARMTAMPVSAAETNPVDARRLLLMSQADALDVVRKSPALAAFLRVQDNANVAHDDIATLHDTEQAVRDMGAATPRGYDFVGDLTGAPMALAQGFGGFTHKLGRAAGFVAAGAAKLGDTLNNDLERLGHTVDPAQNPKVGGAPTALEDYALAKYVAPFDEQKQAFALPEGAGPITKFAHGIGDLLGALPYIVASGGAAGEAAGAAATDSTAAFVQGAAEHGAKAMAIPATSSMVNTMADVAQNTQGTSEAIRAGVAQWLISAAQGAAPVSLQGTRAARVLSGAAVGAATGEVGREAMNLAMPSSMQTPFDTVDLAVGAATGGLLGLTMGGKVAEASVRAPIERIAKTVSDAGRAFTAGEALDRASAAAAESKTAARAGDTFNQLVADMTDGAGADALYLPAEKLAEVLDAQGIDAEELNRILPSVGHQLAEQVALKGDVRIPVSEWLTGVANGPLDTALRGHLKIDPDGIALGDAKKAVEEEVKAFEKVKPEVERTVTEAKAWAKEEQAVKEKMFDAFHATGKYSREVSHAQADLFKHLYSTFAHHAGITPEQALRDYPIDVRTSKWADEALQAMQDRLDQRAYHGSAIRDIVKFEEAFAGTGEGNAAYGAGHYLTEEKDYVAEVYRNIAVRKLERRINQESKEFVVFANGGNIKVDDLLDRAEETIPEQAVPPKSAAVANAVLDVVRPHPDSRTGVVDGVQDILKNANSTEVEKQHAKEWLATYKAAKERYSGAAPTVERRLENEPNWKRKQTVEEYLAARPGYLAGYEMRVRDAKAAETQAVGEKELDIARSATKRVEEELAKRLAEVKEAAGKTPLKGQVYVTELPEDEHLLLWDKYGSEQSRYVKDVLNTAVRPLLGENVDMATMSGQQIYHSLAKHLQSAEGTYTAAMRKASDLLHEAGVAGHTYEGEFAKTRGEGAKNFVIYKGESIKDITTLYQNDGTDIPRAQIEFRGENTPIMHLFEGSDASSPAHEGAHVFLEMYMGLAASPTAPPVVKEMADAILKWTGIESVDAWHSKTLAEREDAHEKVAKGFEAYLYSGKAPTPELASLFAQFRAFLLQAYKATMAYLKGGEATISPEIRSVYDRMLATDEAIAQARRARSMFAGIEEKPEGMSDSNWKAYQTASQSDVDAATAELQAKSLRAQRWASNAKSGKLKELQAEEKAKRREVRIEARRKVMQEPVYMAWSFLRGAMSGENQLKAVSTAVGRDLDPTRDSLLVAIAKLGGISREEAAVNLGVHEDNMTMKGEVFSAPPFRKTGGVTAEVMAERLAEHGYLLPGENGVELADLEEKINDELGGHRHYSVRKDYQERRGSDARDVNEVTAGRLDLADLKSFNLSDAELKALQARGMVAKEGWSPELIASRFGFDSADTMLHELAEGLPPKEAVDAETDRLMLERYSDLATPAAVERAADAAIHGEARVRFVAAELAAQTKALGGSRALAAAAKQIATETVSSLRIRDLRPDRYAAAATRAGKEAGEAYRKSRTPETAQKAATSAELNRLTRKPLSEDEADTKAHIAGEKAQAEEAARLAKGGMDEGAAQAASYPVYEKVVKEEYARLTAPPLMAKDEAMPLAVKAGTKARERAQAALEEKGGKTPFERSVEMRRAQLLNTALAKHSSDAQAEMKAAVQRLRKISKDATSGKYGHAAGAALRGVLHKYDLADMSGEAADRMTSFGAYVRSTIALGADIPVMPVFSGAAKRKFLAKIAERDVEGELIYKADVDQLQVAADILDAEPSMPYINMTVEEMRGLVSVAEQLAKAEDRSDVMYTTAGKLGYSEVADAIASGLIANAGKAAENHATAADVVGSAKEQATDFLHRGVKMSTRFRIADNGVNGPLHDHVLFPANKCADTETAYKHNFAIELHRVLKDVLAEVPLADKLGRGIKIPGLDGVRLNWQQRFAVLLNIGNEGNYQRLLGGGIAGTAYKTLTPAQINAIVATLPASHIRLADKLFEIVSRLRPEVARLERQFNGKEPEWTEARKITVRSSDGVEVELAGGHYPIKYDPRASVKAQEHADRDAKRPVSDVTSVAATTRQTFTKDRADTVNGRPLLLTLGALYSGLNEVIHDVSWREWTRDQNKLLGSHRISEAMHQHYGTQFRSEWRSWVDDMAGGQTKQGDALDYAASVIAKGVSYAGLLFNFTNAVQQSTGLGMAASVIGPKWLKVGADKYLADGYGAVKEMRKLSSFMAHRPITMFRDLNAVRNKVEGQSGVAAWVQHAGFLPMLKMQELAVDTPTWWGAYHKAIDEGMTLYDAKGNADMSRVIAAADQAVKDSQGGGEKVDQAAWERDQSRMAKLATAFYSYGSTQYNVVYGNSKLQKTAGKQLAHFMLAIAGPAAAGLLLKNALTPGDSGNWDTPEHAAKSWFFETLRSLLGMVPVARELSVGALALFGEESQGYQGPSGMRLFADAAKLGKEVHQGVFDTAFRKAAINMAGDVLPGVPSAQANRSVSGASALHEGKTGNPAAILFGYEEPHK